MISTFPGTFLVQPRRRGRHSFRYLSQQCWTTYTLYLLICTGIAGCSAEELEESSTKLTLTADNVCLLDTVPGGFYKLYPVDFQSCLDDDADGYLNVELLVTNQTARNTTSFITDPLFWLIVDTKAQLPILNVSRNGTWPGTTFIIRDDEDPDYFNHTILSLSLRDYQEELPWYASVSAWKENVTFILKAWCTGSKNCGENCEEDSKRCVGGGACKCIISQNNSICHTDVIPLESTFDVEEFEDFELTARVEDTLAHGQWIYYTFEAYDRNARILVELSRQQGDVALFLKPQDSNGSLSVPSGSDFERYSDKSGFQDRRNTQHRYTSGGGSFIVGILNNDACVEEEATFSLAVAVAGSHTEWTLCPFNCSFPQGRCIKDAVCACEDGYAGVYCDASVTPAELFEAFGDNLLPGEIAYYVISLDDVVGTNSLSIEFTRGGGHPILLLGKDGNYPTITDNSLKSLGGPPRGNITTVYWFVKVDSSNESLVLGVYNADYLIRGESTFEVIVLLIESENAKKDLKPTLIILVGFLSSLFACVAMGMVKFIVHRWSGEAVETFDQGAIENIEDVALARRGLDKIVVESFPLIIYQEETKLNEIACVICLNNYQVSDELRVIPPCTHTFHAACADRWLQDHANCPVCRVDLQPCSEQGSLPAHGSEVEP